jgi:hypothetical protein
MAIKPILFNTEMVRAILDGRKSCTRRIIKPQPQGYFEVSEEPLYIYDTDGKQGKITPTYQPGDILYVRETWRVGAWDIFNQMIAFDYKDGTCGELTYIHDRELFDRLVNQSRNDARQAKCEYNGADFVWEKGKSPCRWHPSIHMPKEAARIWLKVTDVRVERLQDITEEQACMEGTDPWDEVCYENNGWHPTFSDPDSGGDPNMVDGFHKLWNSTIKKSDLDRYGWDANPWVWVIEFERCEKPKGV